MKRIIPLLILLNFIFVPKEARASINLFGYVFQDNAFSDSAQLISGKLDYWGFSKWGYPITGDDTIDLPHALNGSDLYTAIEGKLDNYNKNSYYTVEVNFVDNFLFNGNGSDLTVWERGSPEPFRVSIFNSQTNNWTESNYYQPDFVGMLSNSVDLSPDVNVAEVDFSYWSLPKDIPINKVRLTSDFDWSSADIAALGGLNSRSVVPEPASILLFSFGGLGLLIRRKRKV